MAKCLLVAVFGIVAVQAVEEVSCEASAEEAAAASAMLLQVGLHTSRSASAAAEVSVIHSPKDDDEPLAADDDSTTGGDTLAEEEEKRPKLGSQQRSASPKAAAEAFAAATISSPSAWLRPAAVLQLGGAVKRDDASGDGSGAEESDAELEALWEEVMANKNAVDTDPLWASAVTLIKKHTLATDAKAQQYVAMCKAGELKHYTNLACSANADGSTFTGSAVADAYYCGSQKSGIDWSKTGYKVTNLCDAELGSAYSPDGICSSFTQKQLVMNFLETVPEWSKNPLMINVPSIDCILGLGDCDIYYCQHCAGRCG